MRPIDSLESQLAGLDGKDYAAYQSLLGTYAYPRFRLHLDRIPKDPYAPPGTGTFRVAVSLTASGLAPMHFEAATRARASRDFLARTFHAACAKHCAGRRGTGHGGVITVAEPGEEILERSSVVVTADEIEVRFFLGLPARERRIDARTAAVMLFEELPAIVDAALFAASIDVAALEVHWKVAEDAEALRGALPGRGLVAFVADGAVLPRRSGVDPRPLEGEAVVPFVSPKALRVELELPHAGRVRGMGIPRGVTLIVGGGYHGKSTLLEAIELGVYDHVPGDGRELCITMPTAVKIRAASGRSVTSVDISSFIGELPQGDDPRAFSTANASGSTSQAAFLAEALEAGAGALLMDEDTCAANFMIRDARMQQLVVRDEEPITTLIDHVRGLYRDLGVSTVLVMGGSGDYFDVADCVVQMASFEPRDVTDKVRDIVRTSPSKRTSEARTELRAPRARVLSGRGFEPLNAYGHHRITARDRTRIVIGEDEIELDDVEQLTEISQTRAIAGAIDAARLRMDGETPLREVIEGVMKEVARQGLDVLDARTSGQLAGFRGLELAAAINRARSLIAGS